MQLHISQIECYTRCPEQFRRRYICGEKLPPGIALITGSGMHKGNETTLRYKMDKKELPPVEMAKEAARDYVADEFEKGEIFLNDEEKDAGLDATRAAAIDTATALTAIHHKILAPEVNPISVERAWVLEIKGFPVSLGGTIDTDEGDIIDDWKSSAKSPSEGAADESSQLTMYCLAKKVLDGSIPRARIGYLIKTKEPKALWQETSRTNDDFKSLLFIIERVSAAIEKECFPFAAAQSPRPWICSKKFCGYYDTCPAISRRLKS